MLYWFNGARASARGWFKRLIVKWCAGSLLVIYVDTVGIPSD